MGRKSEGRKGGQGRTSKQSPGHSPRLVVLEHPEPLEVSSKQSSTYLDHGSAAARKVLPRVPILHKGKASHISLTRTPEALSKQPGMGKKRMRKQSEEGQNLGKEMETGGRRSRQFLQHVSYAANSTTSMH